MVTYKHHILPFGKLELHRIEHVATKAHFTFVPEFGAIIQSLHLHKKDQLFEVIDGYHNYEEAIANRQYKSSHLIPFPNRIKEGRYLFADTIQQLPLNFAHEGNAIHGLISDQPLKIQSIELGQEVAKITLQQSFKPSPGYPFSYKTTIIYRFSLASLTCEVVAQNTSSTNIPMGIGWHPYFKINDKKADELYLKLPRCKMLQTKEMIPTGVLSDYNKFNKPALISDTEFDTGFLVHHSAEVVLKDEEHNVSLHINSKNCSYLQVYIPPERTSIAVEPMTCATNAFNNQMGLQLLAPKESLDVSYTVDLR